MSATTQQFEQQFEQTEDLIATMKALLEELPGHKSMVKRAWKGTVVATGVAIAAIIMSIFSYVAILDIHELRTETQVAACVQANDLLERQRAALINSLVVLADDPENLTPEEQELVALYTASVEKELPNRDCSPAGLKEFYNPTIAPEVTQ